MITFQQSIDVQASPSAVWAVLADLGRWPQWTPTVSQLDQLTPGAVGVGTQVLIRQPKLRPARWTVTDWQPGRSFSWVSSGAGLSTRARHDIQPTSDGCRLVLDVDMAGWFAPLAGMLAGSLTKRYLWQECQGLKAASEKSLAAPSQSPRAAP